MAAGLLRSGQSFARAAPNGRISQYRSPVALLSEERFRLIPTLRRTRAAGGSRVTHPHPTISATGITHRRAPLTIALVAVLAAGLAAGFAARPPAAQAGVSALPGHFGLGVKADASASGIDGWMPGTGVPWDYAYEYLSGGVGTGAGWETWNSNAQYPLIYAQDAAARGYIPVLTYYELAQSTGPCGSCAEDQRDLAHLNAPATMAAYYANFATLMQRLGPGTYSGIAGFGRPVIIHVEPDLSGYAEAAVRAGAQCYAFCTGQGSDPALLKASVTASGYGPVAGYPDTYQGFNWALLHLRDLYAPNVLLAFHISGWATGQDLDSSNDMSLNAAALGTEAGTFAAQSGVTRAPVGTSTYDLIFNDVADRDAGYYDVVYGDPSRWWDRLNVAVPNFHRWEQYLGAAITAAGGRPAFVWQVPLGNQYFQTENNTTGHYQDNRAEYFLGHVDELVQTGVVGVLFGAGNDGSTVNYDEQGDGVTNPAAICTTRGVSSGQVCNSYASTVADDDGGYLRQAARAYYAAPKPLPGASSPSPSPAPSPTATRTVPPSPTATRTVPPPTSTATATKPASTATATTGGTGRAVVLYDNAFRNGFTGSAFAYSSRKACDGSTYVSASCSYAIAYKAWGGLSIMAGAGGFQTAPYARLEWTVRTNGLPLSDFSVLLTDNTANQAVIREITLTPANVTATLANGWVRVTVPVAQLNPASVAISTVQLKNATGQTLPQINLDDIRFVNP